jgi:hypothetical protein
MPQEDGVKTVQQVSEGLPDFSKALTPMLFALGRVLLKVFCFDSEEKHIIGNLTVIVGCEDEIRGNRHPWRVYPVPAQNLAGWRSSLRPISGN